MSDESSLIYGAQKSFYWTALFQNELLFIMKAFKPWHFFEDMGIFLFVVLKNMRDLNALLIYGTKAVSSSTVPVILRILLSAGTSMVSPCLIQVPLISAVPLRHIAMTND